MSASHAHSLHNEMGAMTKNQHPTHVLSNFNCGGVVGVYLLALAPLPQPSHIDWKHEGKLNLHLSKHGCNPPCKVVPREEL